MNRRDLITLLGGAAAWPIAARGQQPALLPVVGYLDIGTPSAAADDVAALRDGLGQAGYIDGRNLAIEFRFAQQNGIPLSELARDLVSRQVAVIVATGGPLSVRAAKAATSTIPIVFVIGADPVKYGLVSGLNRPSGNVTGASFVSAELEAKRLDLLLQVAPSVSTVAYLLGSSRSPIFDNLANEMLAAARPLQRRIITLEVHNLDFEGAFAPLVQRQAEALIVGGYRSFLEPRNRDQILSLASRYKIPAIYPYRQFTDGGGLMSYSADIRGSFRRAGLHYVGQILKGAKPSDLPVEEPTKFDLVINLKTAKALGLTIPESILVRADQVIE
jgi:putative ABC transport system substrate-binding protein